MIRKRVRICRASCHTHTQTHLQEIVLSPKIGHTRHLHKLKRFYLDLPASGLTHGKWLGGVWDIRLADGRSDKQRGTIRQYARRRMQAMFSNFPSTNTYLFSINNNNNENNNKRRAGRWRYTENFAFNAHNKNKSSGNNGTTITREQQQSRTRSRFR